MAPIGPVWGLPIWPFLELDGWELDGWELDGWGAGRGLPRPQLGEENYTGIRLRTRMIGMIVVIILVAREIIPMTRMIAQIYKNSRQNKEHTRTPIIPIILVLRRMPGINLLHSGQQRFRARGGGQKNVKNIFSKNVQNPFLSTQDT